MIATPKYIKTSDSRIMLARKVALKLTAYEVSGSTEAKFNIGHFVKIHIS